MTPDSRTAEHFPSPSEERANTLSAGLGLLFVLSAIPVLLIVALQKGNAWTMAGAAIYSATLALLYLASTIYHAVPPGSAKRYARIFDHMAIFLLIAGTYTPFGLGPMRGYGGGWFLAVVWTMAAFGIALEILSPGRRLLPGALYLIMGWLGVFFPSFQRYVPPGGLTLLLAGGIAYTAGVTFYIARRTPYMHLIWHLFVLVGTICHFWAVLRYAL